MTTFYENRMLEDRDQTRTHYAYENRMMGGRVFIEDGKGTVTKPGKVDGDSKWRAVPAIKQWRLALARKRLELEAGDVRK